MKTYYYEIRTELTGEVTGEDNDDALVNLRGLRGEVEDLLRKLGVRMRNQRIIMLEKEVDNENVET